MTRRGRPANWFVRVTLLGRRDGGPVPGVGDSERIGPLRSYTEARRAVQSWESDPKYRWAAHAVQKPGRRA
jgi:hypothetical protein